MLALPPPLRATHTAACTPEDFGPDPNLAHRFDKGMLHKSCKSKLTVFVTSFGLGCRHT